MTLSKAYIMNFSNLHINNEVSLVTPIYLLERERERL
jgi:hypothetical protein